MKRTAIGNGAYEGENETFWFRATIDGKRTWRKLPATSRRGAKTLVSEISAQRSKAALGVGLDPLVDEQPTEWTIGTLIDQYIAEGCPDTRLEPREPEYARTQASYLKRVREFFGDYDPNDIRRTHCKDFAEWRIGIITEKFAGKVSGKRSVDVELTMLSCVLSWAVAAEHIEFNFIGRQRPRQVRASEVVHCRDRAPESGDELHSLATELFSTPSSEVFGWQLLMEAFTGCRTSEVLALRMDARPSQPGFVDDYLWLKRLKRGVNPYAVIHPAFRSMIEAHHEWHRTRFPDGSVWWFPGPSVLQPSDPSSLTRAMKRACDNLGMPPRISHGLRSFYVTVRRSQGASDAQVAAELGITSVKLIRDTYGDIPPNWKGRPGLQWLPTQGEPAWAPWAPKADVEENPAVAQPHLAPVNVLAGAMSTNA